MSVSWNSSMSSNPNFLQWFEWTNKINSGCCNFWIINDKDLWRRLWIDEKTCFKQISVCISSKTSLALWVPNFFMFIHFPLTHSTQTSKFDKSKDSRISKLEIWPKCLCHKTTEFSINFCFIPHEPVCIISLWKLTTSSLYILLIKEPKPTTSKFW